MLIGIRLLQFITKCSKKLLDVEEEHETHVEDGNRKMTDMERKVEVYEKVDRSEDIKKTLEELFAKERQFQDKIDELQQRNKHLEHKLKKSKEKNTPGDDSTKLKEYIVELEKKMSLGTESDRTVKELQLTISRLEEEKKNIKFAIACGRT